MENIFLLILSFLLVMNAIMIISSKNPVHSILFLVMVFVLTTGLLILIGVEFLAMLFLVVYVGAITVLFLFVVMMLNVRVVELNERLVKYIPIGLFIGIVFLLEVILIINSNLWNSALAIYKTNDTTLMLQENFNLFNEYYNIINWTNLEQLAYLLYTRYVYLFFLGGIILLIAMIGAILLTLNQSFQNKRQNVYMQTNRQINAAIKHLA